MLRPRSLALLALAFALLAVPPATAQRGTSDERACDFSTEANVAELTRAIRACSAILAAGGRYGRAARENASHNLRAAHHNRGLALRDRGRLDAALADLDRAIELDAEDSSAYQARSSVHRRRRQLDAALADLDRAIRLEPNNPRYFNLRGNIRRERGEADAAVADYERAIRLDPDLATIYADRALLRERRGDLRGALADFEASLARRPQSWQEADGLATPEEARRGRDRVRRRLSSSQP